MCDARHLRWMERPNDLPFGGGFEAGDRASWPKRWPFVIRRPGMGLFVFDIAPGDVEREVSLLRLADLTADSKALVDCRRRGLC